MTDTLTSNPRALIENLVGYVKETTDHPGFVKALQAIELALSPAAKFDDLKKQCQCLWRTDATLVCRLPKGHEGDHREGAFTWSGEVDTRAAEPPAQSSNSRLAELKQFYAEIVECDGGRESGQMELTRWAIEEIERLQREVERPRAAPDAADIEQLASYYEHGADVDTEIAGELAQRDARLLGKALRALQRERAAHEPSAVDAEKLLEEYDACWIEDERLCNREHGPTRQAAKVMRERFNKARAAVLAAMRPAEPPNAWQPIETAPQGDAIVWLPDKGAVMARLCGDLWYDLTTGWLCEPTLWAPMPAGPSETKNSVETAPEGRGVRDNPPPHALGSSEGADTHSRLSEPDAANVAKPHDDPTAHRVADLRAQSQPTNEPPAVDVAPIAKLTVRDGLVQRAGLYAPGLPDGDHDVFPVPLSPKGELRPHVLAEPPDDVDVLRRIDRAYYDGARQAAAMAHQSLAAMDEWIAGGCGGRGSVTKSAGECGACDKPGEHCANVHGICSRHGGRAHETSEGQSS